MEGILLVDKEKWISSFQVIRKLKRVLYPDFPKIKIGHAGTLDPFATGLMIVLIGRATKRSNQLMGLDKEYIVTMELGYETATYDPEGEMTEKNEGFVMPDFDMIHEILMKCVGKQFQMPPKFSAKKVSGQSAYKLAREGKDFELKPKEIEIYEIEFNRDDIDEVSKRVKFKCKVSSGTYIRSLVVDVGRMLGTYATAVELRRTIIDKFKVEDSLDSKDIENLSSSEIFKYLIN